MNAKVWCTVGAILVLARSNEARWVEDVIDTDAVSIMRLTGNPVESKK